MDKISFVYYFIWFVLSIIALSSLKKNKAVLLFIFIALSFMVGVRYNVGNDYENYIRIFNEEGLNNGFSLVELGSTGSMMILKQLGIGVEVWFFLMSLMTFLCLFKGIERFGISSIGTSMLIYFSFFFFMNHCNLMQHGAMAGWAWLAFSYIKDNDLKHYLIYMLIASSFHILAILLIPFYWILNKDVSFKLAVVILVFSVVFNIYLQDAIFNLLGFGYIGNKIMFYRELYFRDQEINKSISLGMIVYMVLLLLLYTKYFRNDDKHFKVLRNALLLSIFFQVSFKGTGIFDARIGGLYNISLVMLVPYVCKKVPGGVVLLLLYSFALFIATSLTPSGLYDSGYQFTPYQTILFK